MILKGAGHRWMDQQSLDIKLGVPINPAKEDLGARILM
jgi:hypothetical protein